MDTSIPQTNISENTYKDALRGVLLCGSDRGDRTGTGTISTFGGQFIYNISDGFPLLTSKKMLFKPMVHELIWFIGGKTNIADLDESVHPWWRDFVDEDGDLGPVYGKQWRNWSGKVDQLKWVIDEIKRNPNSRRLIVSAWNAEDVPKMALPPCHTMFQFYVSGDTLDMQMYQRSGDMFLGVPYNIASYSLLLMIVAKITGKRPGRFIHTLGDAHIYKNHIEQVKKYLDLPTFAAPRVSISDGLSDIDSVSFDMFELQNYHHGPFIKAPLAV